MTDKISALQLHRTRGVNEKLCIGEVGVDVELCVHAHGHDVALIMEAARKNNYPLVISSSCNRGSILYDRGFRPCSPLNTISCASLSTCLLQSITLVQPLL